MRILSQVLLLLIICLFLSPQHNCHAAQLGSFSVSLTPFSKSIVTENEGNASYLNLYSSIDYSSPNFAGFSFQFSAVDGTYLWEKNDDDAEEATGSLLTQVYFQHESDKTLLRFGRQELEQEWLTDFHESVSLEFLPSDQIHLRTGWSRKFAIADIDELFENFEDIGDDGVFFADLILSNKEATFEFAPYVLHTPDIFTGYGLKLAYSPYEWLLLGAHWGGSSVDETDVKNGSIFHIFATLQRGPWTGGGGVIGTGDGGAGLLDSFGDSIDPFEEASLVYEADALTYYLTAEYQHGSLNLLLIGGRTELDDQYENEFTAILEYDLSNFVEGFSLQSGYTYITADEGPGDSSFFSLAIGWEFTVD